VPTPEINLLEERLRASLMPPALSGNATAAIHSMLEELAAECPPAMARPVRRSRWFPVLSAMAALLLAAAIVLGLMAPETDRPVAAPLAEAAAVAMIADESETMEVPGARWVLVDESTRLEWVADDGWLAAPDGGTMRAMRVQVVDENRIFDEESGMIVSISEPREETVLMPVSTF